MTLVEVLVVSIVLSVVLGVAISVPAAGRRRAQDAHAQASALAAVDAVQVLWERDGAVTDTPDVLADINGRLRWTGPSTPSGDPIEVSVAVDGDVVGIATASASGRCWIVRHTTDGIDRGIRYGRYDLDLAPCTGQVALDLTDDPATPTAQTFADTVDVFTAAGYPAMVLTDSPTGYWRLGTDNPTGATVGPPLTASGPVTAGVAGAIVDDFNGAAGYEPPGMHTLPAADHTATLTPADGFTVEGWAWLADPSAGTQPILTLPGPDPTAAVALLAANDTGHPAILIGNGTATGITAAGPTPTPAGRWIHLAGRHDPTDNTLTLFLDGVQVASTAAPGSPTLAAGQTLTIAGGNVTGRIDEVAIYPTALPDGRIATHHQIGRAGVQ